MNGDPLDELDEAGDTIKNLRADIKRLSEQLALWEWCAVKTREMYGGCFTPEYAAKVLAVANKLANDAT